MGTGMKAVLEIDLHAIQKNFELVQRLSGDSVRIAAVIKSDAYGLGLIEVASALSDAGCNIFFVADSAEAIALRASGITAAIVSLEERIGCAQLLASRAIMPVLNDFEDIEKVRLDGGELPYFLNVNTGFSRFGLEPDRLAIMLDNQVFDTFKPFGVLSHLACSDNVRDETNRLQLERFSRIRARFPGCLHSLGASAALWLGSDYHFDLLRIGSALFGLNNAKVFPSPLMSVVRLRAPIIHVRPVTSHEAVGYSASFRPRRPTMLGIVHIGYKHGLPWACSNRIHAKMGDYRIPVVGRIAMEYTTVDLTDVPSALLNENPLVDFLFDEMDVDALAGFAGDSSQEFLVRLGSCCPREYTYSTTARQTMPYRTERPQASGGPNIARNSELSPSAIAGAHGSVQLTARPYR